MKALILVDMEGASGITTDRLSWTRVHTEDWERFGRDRVTADVVAAARGALAGGAEAVTVMDMHDTGDSIRPDKLPAGARLFGLGDTIVPEIGFFAGCFGAGTDGSERLLVRSREGYMYGFAGYFDVVVRRLGGCLRCWQGRLFAIKLRRNGVLSL